MNILRSYFTALKNYFNFSGRATRSDFWGFFLVDVIVSSVLAIVAVVVDPVHLFTFPFTIYHLLTVIPFIAIWVRRIHDTGRSGWLILIPLYNIYLLFPKSIVDRHQEDEVFLYIKNQQTAGFNDDHIKQTLANAGHQADAIEHYFSSLRKSEAALYRIDYIGVAILLGSPLAGVYMVTKNYLQLGKLREAQMFAAGSLGITLVTFWAISTDVINEASYLGFIIIFWVVAEILQGQQIKLHKQNGGHFFTIGRAALIALAALITTIAFFFILLQIYAGGGTSATETRDTNLMNTNASAVSDEDEDKNSEANELGETDVTNENWNEYVNEELQLSFSYPAVYGDVVVTHDFGAPPGSSFEHERCTTGGELEGTLACTGAIISFRIGAQATGSVRSTQDTKPFMYVHGEYMSIPPQGGWWGALDIDQQSELEPWFKNSALLGVPNTNLYKTEMGGDMSVQFAVSTNPHISHIVIASPVQFGAYTPDTFSKFQTHLLQIPPPPEYENTEAWNEAFSNYVQEVEMYDISDDPELQKYIKVLETISVSMTG